jgi:NodT family efflux transporter outer membrane factor (OMF) lipoprotein
MAVLASCALSAAGCTTLKEWVKSGFKVGPNFEQPPASIAADWIDAADPRITYNAAWNREWWRVFGDPTLDSLIDVAYRENLDLKTTATRVLQAQAQRNIDVGYLLPQTQNAVADYARANISRNLNVFNNPRATLPSNLSVWATGFNASWELDFWGRVRRMIEAANADRDAAIESYQDALVSLTADVATTYVQLRTLQERLTFARRNVEIERGSLGLAEARLGAGRTTALDVKQARSSLAQTEASIPPLEISLRQANNRLCVLLGLPPQDLASSLGRRPIPAAPPEAAVGIPAELLERRPDVRRALEQVASQTAQVGVAEAEFFPHIGVTGFIGYAASDIRRLFAEKSFTGLILPTFSWKILNYGRVVNGVRNQEARLQEKIFAYQQTVLTAGREVEDALAAFLLYQLQVRSLEESVKDAADSVELVQAQYRGGIVDFNRVFTTQSQLVALQDQLAAARGNIAVSLVGVYRALGGGWSDGT